MILDSVFCILSGILELSKVGLFVSALIKKRRYWLNHIKSKAIKEHFENKGVGSVDAWPGTMDRQRFNVFSMKEPGYVINLMSLYGTKNLVPGTETKGVYKG